MLLLLPLLWLVHTSMAGRMEVLYSWSQVDFTFPSSALREVYLAGGHFIPKHNVIIDVDVWGGYQGIDRKIFVTMPKFKPGEPVTLATVTNKRRNHTTLLHPYPDWSWHQGDCDGITSVFRTRVDKCGRLWVLDSGMVDIFVDSRRQCPPQILVFDLYTDNLVKRYRFPKSLLEDDSLLITIALDSRQEDCSDTVAYVTDVTSYKLLVYDSATDKSWKVSSNLFYPYPLHGDFHINGVDFDLMDGLFALAVGPLRNNGDRTLYFHSLASVHESWVLTSVVRNHSAFQEDPGASPRSFHVFQETRDSQSAAQDMTDSGVLLYSLVEQNAIGCWNSHLPFRKQNLDIIAKDDYTLQFQSGLKVYGNHIWTLSSRLQNYIVDGVPEGEINYRINVGRVSDLLRHTRCDVRLRPTELPTFVYPSQTSLRP
ncbi:protein yellow-like isoform X2 [Homalodisca vitripennis]|nr:protein yellow-like isoform X2 [Homalodisca vitripennis]XP_046659966.1 protein yellow-like isoform X2 [Homalodisca vitripennis]XP_046659967.1 protein yellow-like isoform X2 [Homalodisca vitripennis]XP_046659968.1 protein yellow-like isoform X2 [Homalodisca vitripennis]